MTRSERAGERAAGAKDDQNAAALSPGGVQFTGVTSSGKSVGAATASKNSILLYAGLAAGVVALFIFVGGKR